MALENGNPSCPELGPHQQIQGLVPYSALHTQARKMVTDAEGKVQIDGLCPGALYFLMHIEPMRIRTDGLPIYAGASLEDSNQVIGDFPSFRPIRVSTQTELAIRLPPDGRVDNRSGSASFGSTYWELDKLAEFPAVSSRLSDLQKKLHETLVDIEIANSGGSGVVV